MRAYLAKTEPVAATERTPWYRLMLPCYASLFLWLGFYEVLAPGTIDRATYGTLFFGLLAAGFLAYSLFFAIPARMAVQTGYPLGVLGSSTFGSRGGQFVPGLLIAGLEAAWLGFAAWHGARGVLAGLGRDSQRVSGLEGLAVTAVWCLAFAAAACAGVRWIALAAIPLAALSASVLGAGLHSARLGIEGYTMEMPEQYLAFVYTIQLVTALVAGGLAAGPSLARYISSNRDLRLAGLLGIVAPVTAAGSAALLSIAGWKQLNAVADTFSYLELARASGGILAAAAPFLLLAGALPASAFLAWLAMDSVSVMLPGLPRWAGALGVSAAAFATAALGSPANALAFLTVAGALGAPMFGIMAADYWQHDKRWPHTRPGVNLAGYGAWLLGVGFGLLPVLPIPEHVQRYAQPSAVLACASGFAGYILLGNLGLKPYRKHRRKRVRLDRFQSDEPPHNRPGSGL